MPKNHFALLVKWASYRDDKREEKENAKTFAEKEGDRVTNTLRNVGLL